MEAKQEITFNEWIAFYEQNIAKAANFVVYFTGSEDSEGVNWCSDCRDTIGSVNKVEQTAKSQNITFLKVRSGLREEWRNPENPLRTHKFVKATSIPLVVLFQNGKPARKMAYEELLVENVVNEFLEDL